MRKGTGLLLVALCAAILAGCGGPGPTATPAYARYRADDVWRVLVAAGLPVSGWQDYQPAPNSQAPHTWAEAKEFTIATIAPYGAGVYTFAEPGDLAALHAWYARFPDLAPYVYVNANTLVQINNTLPKAEAEKYRAALQALK